jgi:hypothetical protein
MVWRFLNFMKAWRIHFGWAIVTMLAVAVSLRVSSNTSPTPSPAPASSRPEMAPMAQTVEAVPIPVVAALAPPSAPAAAEPVPEEDRIRALIQSERYVGPTASILKGVSNRALQLKLLREMACGEDMRCTFAALQVLRHMKGREVAEILEACVVLDRDARPAAFAARILAEVGDALSYGPLIRSLESTDEETRVSGAEALRKLGFPQAAQDMTASYTRQFESPDGSLRKRAVENLVSLALESSIAVFTRALKDSNGEVRLKALDAFSMLRRKEFLPLLEPLLQDPNREVARKAQDVAEALREVEK